MSTFSELVDALTLELAGYTQTTETASNLSGLVESDDLQITVTDVNSFSRGVVQIEDELIYVASVDTSSGILNVAPGWGRGYLGTVATTHLSGTKAVASPMYPRHILKRYINEVLDASFPTLWKVASTTVTYAAGTTTYTIPATVRDIMQVTWADPVTLEDVPVRRWKHDKYNSKVSIYDSIAPGRDVTIHYRVGPTRLSADTDDFATVTGLPSSCEDVIRLGAVVKALPYIEANNSSILTAEADFAANTRVSSTSALQLSRSLMQVYQLRLAEEGMKLHQQYPVRIHYSV